MRQRTQGLSLLDLVVVVGLLALLLYVVRLDWSRVGHAGARTPPPIPMARP